MAEAPTEAAKEVYSVWALPPDDGQGWIKRIMAALRSEFGGAAFEPHITVVGAISVDPDDALCRFRSPALLSPATLPVSPPPPAAPSSTGASSSSSILPPRWSRPNPTPASTSDTRIQRLSLPSHSKICSLPGDCSTSDCPLDRSVYATFESTGSARRGEGESSAKGGGAGQRDHRHQLRGRSARALQDGHGRQELGIVGANGGLPAAPKSQVNSLVPFH